MALKKKRAYYEKTPPNMGHSMWERFEAMTPKQQEIAMLLAAENLNQHECARRADVTQPYVWQLLTLQEHQAFREVLQWLSLKFGLASRAGRVRYIRSVIKQFEDKETGEIKTKKDPLEWMKLLQNEMAGFDDKPSVSGENAFDFKETTDDELDGLTEDIEAFLAKADERA